MLNVRPVWRSRNGPRSWQRPRRRACSPSGKNLEQVGGRGDAAASGRTGTALETQRRHERHRGNTAVKVASANVTSGYRTTGHGPDTDRPRDTWRRKQAEEGSDIGQG